MELFPGGEGQWGWYKLPLDSKRRQSGIMKACCPLCPNPGLESQLCYFREELVHILQLIFSIRIGKHNNNLTCLKTLSKVKYYPYFSVSVMHSVAYEHWKWTKNTLHKQHLSEYCNWFHLNQLRHELVSPFILLLDEVK